MDLTALSKEIEWKACIMVDGLRIEPEALEGVGTRYNEDISSVFGYYMQDLPPGVHFPSDLRFPLGSVVKISLNPRSAYSVRREDGQLLLEQDGKFLCTVEWIERPRFYDRLTSDGVEMKKVAQIRGECAFMACVSNFCLNWRDGVQCRYCNMNAAHQARGKEVLTAKRPQQVGEVAAAALEEGYPLHLVLSGGTLPEEKATDAYVRYLNHMRECAGLEEVPGLANLAAPLDLKEVDRIHQAGFKCVAYDLEVWNEHLFKAICPGKAQRVGRENWLRALEHAATLFEPGKVICGLVQGLEEKENYYEAAEYLGERGVVAFLIPWVPMQGSKLEGHRPPYGELIYEVNERVFDIVARHIPQVVSEAYFSSGDVTCYRCASVDLYQDMVRERLEGKEITLTLREPGRPTPASHA